MARKVQDCANKKESAQSVNQLAAALRAVFRIAGKDCCNARFHFVIGCSSTKMTSLGRISNFVAKTSFAAFSASR